jgi:hypothetical protein
MEATLFFVKSWAQDMGLLLQPPVAAPFWCDFLRGCAFAASAKFWQG